MSIRRRAASLLLPLACLLGAVPETPAQEPPVSKEEAEALEARATDTVKALELGLKSKEAAERRAAVLGAAGVPHAKVAKALGKAAGDKDPSVRVVAVDSLGTLGHPEALKELHRHAKKAKQWKDDPAALVALYRGIGRYGDKSSVDVLMDDPWLSLDNGVVKARVYALGNVRDVASVEGLLKLMNLAKPLPGEDSPFMPHFRVALTRLTGTDQTTNKSLWQKWWRDNKKGFAVSPEPAPMPAELQPLWDEFWGIAAEDAERDAGQEAEEPPDHAGGG